MSLFMTPEIKALWTPERLALFAVIEDWDRLRRELAETRAELALAKERTTLGGIPPKPTTRPFRNPRPGPPASAADESMPEHRL